MMNHKHHCREAFTAREAMTTKPQFCVQDFILHHKMDDERLLGESYYIGRRLGSGGYGAVYECRHKPTGMTRAIKVISKPNPSSLTMSLQQQPPKQQLCSSGPVYPAVADTTLTPVNTTNTVSVEPSAEPASSMSLSNNNNNNNNNNNKHATNNDANVGCKPPAFDPMNEFRSTKQLDHPNCPRVYECFEDSRHVYIVMDYYQGGDLLHAVTTQLGRFKEDNCRLLINQILSTIHYLYSQQHVSHLDCKLENLCFTSDDYRLQGTKIIDFGLSVTNVDESNSRVFQTVGSTQYMSPQAFFAREFGFDPHKQDVWSVGVIAYMLLAGAPPFPGHTDSEIYARIMRHDEKYMFSTLPRTVTHSNNNNNVDPFVWSTVSEDAKDFIRSLMTYDEHKRPSAAVALEHPWLSTIRHKAALDMDLSCRDDPVYGDAIRSVFSMLLRDTSNDTGSLLWKQATATLLAAQYSVTGAQRELLDDCFNALDLSHTGVITKAHLCEGLKRFGVVCDNNQDSTKDGDYYNTLVDNVFARLATGKARNSSNNDDDEPALTYSDFVIGACSDVFLSDEDRLRFSFEYLSQGSEYISHRSLHATLLKTRPDGDKVATAMMQEVESVIKNKTGLISFSDFLNLVRPPQVVLPKDEEQDDLYFEDKEQELEDNDNDDDDTPFSAILPWSQALADSVMDVCGKSCFSMLEKYMLCKPIASSSSSSSSSSSETFDRTSSSCKSSNKKRGRSEEGDDDTICGYSQGSSLFSLSTYKRTRRSNSSWEHDKFGQSPSYCLDMNKDSAHTNLTSNSSTSCDSLLLFAKSAGSNHHHHHQEEEEEASVCLSESDTDDVGEYLKYLIV